MSKFYLGNDIVWLSNFRKSLNERFISKVYTDREKAYCNQFEYQDVRYASTWAAKESVFKALKQSDPKIKLSWKKIEILRSRPAGAPSVQIVGLKNLTENISLSISHDGDYVWACALLSCALPGISSDSW